MSSPIELKPTVQPTTAPQNPDLPVELPIPEPDYSPSAAGNENGGVYFELNWQNGQAQNVRQNLLTAYNGGNSNETETYGDGLFPDPEFSGYGNGILTEPNSSGFTGNHYGYNNHLIESNPYGYGVNPNETVSLYSLDDSTILSWDDLVNFLTDNEDFADFQHQTPDFWREVKELSETAQVFQNDDQSRTEGVSKYEEILAKIKSKELAPEEFAETLPPKEKEVFLARYQIDETFGANLFEDDGVTLSETGQFRLREAALESGQAINLPANLPPESRESNIAPVIDTVAPLLTRREIINNAKNAVIFGENIPNRPLSKKIESGEVKLQDKSTSIAVGNSNNLIVADNTVARVAGNVNSDNSSSVHSIGRRDGGTVMGGALINGSFASIENFKNAENSGIASSGSVSNPGFDGSKSFAAGATGVMMSAAIGSLIPGSDAVISGVVGFISGVVIGVEADQGLRWLSGDRPTTIVPTANLNLLEDNSFAASLEPVLA